MEMNDNHNISSVKCHSITTTMCSMRPKRETAADMTALVARLKACASQSSQSHHKRNVTTTATNDSTTSTTTAITSSGNTCATTTATTDSVRQTVNEENARSEHVFRAGMKVEAKDAVGDWYASKVVDVSEDGRQCLVHFTRWSSRFDEWVPVSSVRMRSADTTLKSENNDNNAVNATTNQSVCGTSAHSSDKTQEYAVGEQVLARWSDGKRYSATIRHVFVEQNAVLVVFDDNYRKKVKLNAISKIDSNYEQNISIKQTNNAMIPSTTTTTTTSNDNVVVGGGNGGVNGFIKCGTCGKTFRKASLMLWHERHCTQTTENVERRKHPQQSSEQHQQQPQQQSTQNTSVTPVTPVVVKRAANVGVAPRRTRRTKSGRRRRRRFTTNTTTNSQQICNDDNILSTNNTESPLVSTSTDNNVIQTSTTTTTSVDTNVVMGNARKAVKRRRSSQRPDVTVVQTTVKSTLDSLSSSSRAVSASSGAPHVTHTPPPQPNTRLPFWDAKGVAEQHESDDVPEVVHCCHCDEFEESGLMVQCDLCLSWQHAACVGYNANCDHEYICGACLRPRLMRASKRFDFSVSLLLKPNSRFRENTFHISNGQFNASHGDDGHRVGGSDALAHAFERVHDVSQVISSLSARVAKLDRNDGNEQNDANDAQMMDIARTQQKLQSVLNALEEKVNHLEQNDANDVTPEQQSHDDAWIKLQTQLLFEDLKNARKICEN